jgi:hypothetical protein
MVDYTIASALVQYTARSLMDEGWKGAEYVRRTLTADSACPDMISKV